MSLPTCSSVCAGRVVTAAGELVAEAGEGNDGEAQHEQTLLHLGVGSVAPLLVGEEGERPEKAVNPPSVQNILHFPGSPCTRFLPRESRRLILRCVRRISSEICASLTTSES